MMMMKQISLVLLLASPTALAFPLVSPGTHRAPKPLSASLLTLNGDDGIETVTIPPLTSVDGEFNLPGCNLASQYVLLLSALAKGNTTIGNLLSSDDCSQMRESLWRLGVTISNVETETVDPNEPPLLEIAGGDFLVNAFDEMPYRLWMGVADSTLNVLTAVFASAANPGTSFIVDGMQQVREHNAQELIASVKSITGVEITTTEGFPPLTIPGTSSRNIPSEAVVDSKSLPNLLLAAPLLDEDITLLVNSVDPNVPLVLGLMELFGVKVQENIVEGMYSYHIDVGSRYQSPGYVIMEGDAISASYLVAGAVITGGTITAHGCGSRSLQPEIEFAQVVAQMGGTIEVTDTSITATRDPNTKLSGVDVDCARISESAMTLAILALFASGTTTLRNLRWSETRMAHMVSEIRKAGAGVDNTDDTLIIYPPSQVKNYVVYETYDDHRMAMAFSLIACGCVTAIIKNPSVTAKSFPTFFKVLKQAATLHKVN